MAETGGYGVLPRVQPGRFEKCAGILFSLNSLMIEGKRKVFIVMVEVYLPADAIFKAGFIPDTGQTLVDVRRQNAKTDSH